MVSTRINILLLGGLFFILVNMVILLFGTNIKPNVWLFYLNAHYWHVSAHLSLALWITVAWLALEATDIVEDYLPTIRIATFVCFLLVIISALWMFGLPAPNFATIFIIASCCAIRSGWLLCRYRYDGEESIDIEEARWFWGMSGFFFAVLIITGMMCTIHLKVLTDSGIDTGRTISLFSSCRNDIQILIERGSGSFAIRALGFLVLAGSFAFVYVAGRWALIFLTKVKEGWE